MNFHFKCLPLFFKTLDFTYLIENFLIILKNLYKSHILIKVRIVIALISNKTIYFLQMLFKNATRFTCILFFFYAFQIGRRIE